MKRCKPGTQRNKRTNECEPCPDGTTRIRQNCVKINMEDYDDPETFTCTKKRCPPKSRKNKNGKCEKCPPNRTLFKNRCYSNMSMSSRSSSSRSLRSRSPTRPTRRSPIVTHIPQSRQIRRVPYYAYGHHH